MTCYTCACFRWKIPKQIVFIIPNKVYKNHEGVIYYGDAVDSSSTDSIARAYDRNTCIDNLIGYDAILCNMYTRSYPRSYCFDNKFVIKPSLGFVENNKHMSMMMKVIEVESELEFDIPIDVESIQNLMNMPDFKFGETPVVLTKANGITGALPFKQT